MENKISNIPITELVLMYQETDKPVLKNILFKTIKNRFSKTIRKRTRYYNSIYGVENEECVSVLLLTLLKAADTFDNDMDTKFSTYFYSCTRNYMSNYIRRKDNADLFKSRSHYIDDCVELDSIPDPVTETEGFITDAHKILQCLSGREQGVIMSHVYDGVSFKELAEKMGLTRQRVNQIFNRTVEKIRREYNDKK